MVWQKAALPISCCIVLDTTTTNTPRRHAGTNNAVEAAWGAVILCIQSVLATLSVTSRGSTNFRRH